MNFSKNAIQFKVRTNTGPFTVITVSDKMSDMSKFVIKDSGGMRVVTMTTKIIDKRLKPEPHKAQLLVGVTRLAANEPMTTTVMNASAFMMEKHLCMDKQNGVSLRLIPVYQNEAMCNSSF